MICPECDTVHIDGNDGIIKEDQEESIILCRNCKHELVRIGKTYI